MWSNAWLLPLTLGTASLPFAFGIARNLEYEYASLTAWLQLVIFPCFALAYPSQRNLHLLPVMDKTPWYKITGWLFIVGPLLALLPGSYAFLFKLCKCQPQEFLFWMGIQWFPAWLLANALVFGIWRLRAFGYMRGKLIAAVVLIYGALLIQAAAILWFAPQKRLTHLLLGFLHGPIYDTWIPVDTGIVLARLSHALAAGLLLIAVCWRRTGTAWIWTMLLTASWLGTSYSAGQFKSTGSGATRLNTYLVEQLKHPHFTLHYRDSKRLTASEEVPLAIRRLYHDAAFHAEELVQLFGERATKHVDIYVYPDQLSKKLWFGGGATDVADVFTPSIHITPGNWPHGTLRHELVHAMAADFGFHGLGFHPNMAFTEGLAMALAPTESNLSYDESVAALLHAKKLPQPTAIFSPLFWREASNRAYVVAGSLINYLIDTKGIQAVADLYSGKSWQQVIGGDSRETIAAWHQHVQREYDAERYALYTEAVFRDPGVWRGLCVHSRATLRQERSQSLFTRLRQPPGWSPDIDYWEWRAKLDPLDQQAKLNLMRLDAANLTVTNTKASDIQQTLDKLTTIKRWPPKSLEDIELTILESDLHILLGDQKRSEELLRMLVNLATQKNIGADLQRQVEARLLLYQLGDTNFRVAWTRYLGGWRTKPPVPLQNTEPWLLQYLRLRRGEASVVERKVLSDYARNPPTDRLSKTFAIEWYKFLGHRFMEVGLYTAAADAYQIGGNFAEPGQRAWLMEQQRRARYYRDKVADLATATLRL